MRRNNKIRMVRKIKEKCTDKNGEGYIDTALTVFIVAILLVLCLNVFTLFQLKHNVNFIANELIECATTYGRINTETTNRLNELKRETGLNPTVDYSGTAYFDSSRGTVQLGNTIKVKVSCNYTVLGFGMVRFPVTITCNQSGLSQVYWK